jgi:translocation and assembly module TamB
MMRRILYRWRWIVISFGTVVGATTVLLVGVWIYLSTASARNLVAATLGRMLGTTVEVQHISVGWRSSGVRIKMLEAPDGAGDASTLLTAENAEAVISLPQLLSGDTPSELRLSGAVLTLRLDRDGRLLTRIPHPESGAGELPTVTLRGARVAIAQEGRREFIVGGIHGSLQSRDGRVLIDANLHDPEWGEWSAEGAWDLQAVVGSLALQTESAQLSQDRLKTVPWVPPVVWEQVQAEGKSAATVRIARDGRDDAVHTNVVLKPQGASIGVAAIDLALHAITGSIEIDDAVVHLHDMSARAANGHVNVDGKLDFESTPSILQFQVNVRDIDLRRLPASWSLPPQLEGSLRGAAEIELAIRDGEVETRGQGHGEVEHARVAGIPAERVALRLTADGKRFHFLGAENAAAAFTAVFTGIALQAPAGVPKPPPAVELSFEFKDVDIAEVIQRAQVQLPIQVAGRVSLSAKARLPLDRMRDFRAYQLTGRASASRLTIEGVDLADLRADLTFQDGVLSLANLSGSVPGENRNPRAVGKLAGGARLGLFPQSDLTAEFSLDRIPVGAILRRLGVSGEHERGVLAGRVAFQSPLAGLRDPKNWAAAAELRSDHFQLFGRNLSELQLAIRVADGIARSTRATVRGEGIALQGDGSLELATPYPFSAQVRLSPLESSDLRRLVPELELPEAVSGRLEAAGNLRGTLTPWTITATGTGGASAVRVASAHLERVGFNWLFDNGRLQIRDIRAQLYDGAVTATLDLPTAANADTKFAAVFERINAGPLVRDWPAIPIGLQGRVNGTLDALFAARTRRFTADLNLSSPRLRVAGVPTDRFRAQLHYRPEAVDYEFTGEPLGGKLVFAGRAPLDPPGLPDGRLQLERLDLSRWSPDDSTLRGRADFNLTYRNQGGSLSGQGRLEIRGLGGLETEISDRLTADLRVAGSVITVDGPTGALAGGDLRGRGRYDLSRRERGFISLRFTSVDARRLLSPWPKLAANVNAIVDGQVRGSLGREFSGTGQISFSRGHLFGLTVTDGRFPFDWAYALGGSGELKFHEMTAQGGSGRFTGDSDFQFGLDHRLTGRVRFTGVDLKSVLTETADFNRISGRADGRFDFHGENVRDFDDLSGILAANFTQTSALEAPILRPIAPYIAPGQSLTGFTRGDLLAHLAHGVFRVQRLTLEAPSLRLYGEGSVTVEGRLDLAINAMTGQIGANPDLIRLTGLRLPTIGPIPVTMIVRASNMLSNHLIRLRVGGTIRAPSVQVNAAALLSEGVLRYFLSSSGVSLP